MDFPHEPMHHIKCQRASAAIVLRELHLVHMPGKSATAAARKNVVSTRHKTTGKHRQQKDSTSVNLAINIST